MLFGGSVLAHRSDVSLSERFFMDCVPVEFIEILAGRTSIRLNLMNGAVLAYRFIVRVLVLGVPLLFFKVRVKVAAILIMSLSVFDMFFFEPGVYGVMLVPFAEVLGGRLVFFCNIIEVGFVVDCGLRPVKLLMVTVRHGPLKLFMSSTMVRIVTIVVVMRTFLMV